MEWKNLQLLVRLAMFPLLQDINLFVSEDNGSRYAGKMDDLRIYSRSLSTSEIQVNSVIRTAMDSMTLVKYWQEQVQIILIRTVTEKPTLRKPSPDLLLKMSMKPP